VGVDGGAVGRQLRHPEGVIYGFPVTCSGGKYEIVQGLAINEFSRARMDATYKELLEERDRRQGPAVGSGERLADSQERPAAAILAHPASCI